MTPPHPYRKEESLLKQQKEQVMNRIISQLHSLELAYGQIALCRLGQHSFLVKLGKTLVGIDLYLRHNPARLIPVEIPAEEMEGISLYLGSHDHSDHIDRVALPAMAAASPEAKLAIPAAVADSVTEFPADRILPVDAGDTLTIGDIKISVLASAHEFLEQDAQGHYCNLGFVLSGNGVTLYHSGDCCRYETLQTQLAKFKCDIMLLPINGRDAVRYKNNIIGNMTYQEAADLAGELNVPLTIPCHYDMFACNTADPELFTDYMACKYPALKTQILPPYAVEVFTMR